MFGHTTFQPLGFTNFTFQLQITETLSDSLGVSTDFGGGTFGANRIIAFNSLLAIKQLVIFRMKVDDQLFFDQTTYLIDGFLRVQLPVISKLI